VTHPDAVTASVRIAATPDVVFPYFTDATLMREWIGHWTSSEPWSGGAFAVDFERAPVRGSYLAVEPPHRVVFTWGIAGNDVLPAGSSTVEVTLRADGEDTIVELVHRGLPEARKADHQSGWTALLATLSKLVP
jgi:uncharacterized protein YndB with AHSA1/START domain